MKAADTEIDETAASVRSRVSFDFSSYVKVASTLSSAIVDSNALQLSKLSLLAKGMAHIEQRLVLVMIPFSF